MLMCLKYNQHGTLYTPTMIIYFNTPTCFGPTPIFRDTIKYKENILDTIMYPADNKRKKEVSIKYETS